MPLKESAGTKTERAFDLLGIVMQSRDPIRLDDLGADWGSRRRLCDIVIAANITWELRFGAPLFEFLDGDGQSADGGAHSPRVFVRLHPLSGVGRNKR